MTPRDLDPDLERLGGALRASTAIHLAREEEASHSADARARRARDARRSTRWPRALAGSTLGLAGIAAALLLALGGTAGTSPALAVTRQADGSVLVTVNVDASTSWVGPADSKLAAMGIDEQILLSHQDGAPPVSGLVDCSPLSGADAPTGPPVKVLFTRGAAASGEGDTGADSTMVSGCAYFATPDGSDTGDTGTG